MEKLRSADFRSEVELRLKWILIVVVPAAGGGGGTSDGQAEGAEVGRGLLRGVL